MNDLSFVLVGFAAMLKAVGHILADRDIAMNKGGRGQKRFNLLRSTALFVLWPGLPGHEIPMPARGKRAYNIGQGVEGQCCAGF